MKRDINIYFRIIVATLTLCMLSACAGGSTARSASYAGGSETDKTVTGTIVDDETGAPAADIAVVLQASNAFGAVSTSTDVDGNFRLEDVKVGDTLDMIVGEDPREITVTDITEDVKAIRFQLRYSTARKEATVENIEVSLEEDFGSVSNQADKQKDKDQAEEIVQNVTESHESSSKPNREDQNSSTESLEENPFGDSAEELIEYDEFL